MAGIKHTATVKVQDDAGRVVGSSVTEVTGEEELEFSVSVPAGNNVTVTMAVHVSAVQGFYIVADGALTLLENTADYSTELAKGVPLYWYGQGANPFSVDIATLKFTNGGTGPVLVHGAFLVNPA